MRGRRGLAALCALVVLPLASTASAHTSEETALAEARQRVAAIARQLESVAANRQQAAAAVADAEARVAAVEGAVNAAAAALERQELVVARAEEELAGLIRRAAELRGAFASRAAALYRQGTSVPLELLLSADSVQTAVDRGAFISQVTRSDRAALEQLDAAQVAVRAQQARVEEERAHLEALRAQQEELLEQVRQVLSHRRMRLAESRHQEARLRHQKEDLEEDAHRLTNLIKVRQRRARQMGPPSTAGYVWPLCGRVTSGFGRRWGRVHAGIDIDGATGDPIVAAKDGVVIYAGWRGGYGRLTLVDHGDGAVTAYAHQSAIGVAVGQEVARAQRIGAVGSTGNSTGSHLHFETRVNGQPVNPMRFLPRGC